jgi:tetratricopeptide (TPR) repeat protein
VAKANPLQLKRDADGAEKKGDYAKAIELLKQIVQDNPNKPDWNTINRIGDLYAKLNNLGAANEQYKRVARHWAEDGFHLKSIALWKKVLKNDPSDLTAKEQLGDLYARQGLAGDAKQAYGEVIEEYIRRGRKEEAGKVLKRMAELDPSDIKVRGRLADLYRDSDPERAAAEYVAIADELVKKGHHAEALQLVDKSLRAGPRSPRLLTAAARVHLVQKDYARAIGHLEEAQRAVPADREVALRLAEAYLGAKRSDDARRVLEGLLQRDPSDQDARQQLGHVYLAGGLHDEAFEQLLPVVEKLVERRQIDHAAALLQQIVQRNPSHIRSLAKLVELYRQSRNDMLVAQTYSQMVEAYLAAGGLEQAASILEMLVQLEPSNEQHRSKLRWLREQQGVQPSEGFEVDLEKPAPPPVAVPAPPARPAGIELSGPLTPDDLEFIGEHLAEGRVFRKYGLVEKARDQFEAVLGRFPDNLEALQELVGLHREKGETDAAARRLRTMAEVHRLKGDEPLAAKLDAEAGSLAPLGERAEALAPAVRAAPPASAEVGLEITVEEPAPPAAEGEPSPLDDSLVLEPAPLEPEPEPEAEPQFTEEDLGPPGAGIGGGFIDEEEPDARGFDLEEAAPSAPPPLPLVVAAAPPAIPASDVPADLRRALDEIESYVSMGFVDDAKGVLDEVGPRMAGHPALARRLAELGLGLPAPPAPPPAAPEEAPLQFDEGFLEFTPTTPPPAPPPPPEPLPAGGGGDGFDLASELDGLFGAQPAVAAEAPPAEGTDLGDASLTDIFREFQKGVDKQLGREDYETRYNLGIAYKEMGLVDEAIAEFQLAAKDEGRLLECASMLGICFLEKGMPKLAVKWFEKGLTAHGRSEEEYQGLRYDLASAHEQAGETDRALALFTELYGQDASFRDVAEKVRALGARG